jgi:hypothetical protein
MIFLFKTSRGYIQYKRILTLLISVLFIGHQNTLNPWNQLLLVELIIAQLIKKFAAFYEIKKFTAMFIRVHH